MSFQICPVTGFDVKDTQMILVQACGHDMKHKVKYGDEEKTRHDFATERVAGLAKALLQGDSVIDFLLCGKSVDWVNVKDADSVEEIAKRTSLDSRTTNLAAAIDACWEKHKYFCANNSEHRLTTAFIVTSGKTHNHTMFNGETESQQAVRSLIRKLADRCQNAGEPQIRLVFAPVAPEDADLVFLQRLCMPETRQKLIASTISLIHPLDRDSVMRMATVYDSSLRS
jgi:hypothetical protein